MNFPGVWLGAYSRVDFGVLGTSHPCLSS